MVLYVDNKTKWYRKYFYFFLEKAFIGQTSHKVVWHPFLNQEKNNCYYKTMRLYGKKGNKMATSNLKKVLTDKEQNYGMLSDKAKTNIPRN